MLAKSTIDSIMKVCDVVDTLDRKGKTIVVHRIQRQLAEKPAKVSKVGKKKTERKPDADGAL